MTILLANLLMVAAAGTSGQSPNCADPVTQSDMTRCAVLDYERADAALNRQWKITGDEMKQNDANSRGTRGPGYFAVLLEAQRAWLKYRDTHCISSGYQARGGSMQPMLVAICRTTLTHDRTQQLKDLAEQGV